MGVEEGWGEMDEHFCFVLFKVNLKKIFLKHRNRHGIGRMKSEQKKEPGLMQVKVHVVKR